MLISSNDTYQRILPLFTIDLLEESALCLPFFEKSLEQLLSTEWISRFRASSPEEAQFLLAELIEQLPLVKWSFHPGKVIAILLAPGRDTQGVGRYFSDSFSRWLSPGRSSNICQVNSLDFQLSAAPGFSFFISRILVDLDPAEDRSILQNNIETLIEEMRINILAVQHLRQVVAHKKLSDEEKQLIIQENISSLLNRPAKNFDVNLYDQMHHLLLKLTAEEKTKQLNQKLKNLLEKHPDLYSRDLFNELQHFVLLFRDKFTATHDTKTLAHIISCHFLFQKKLENQVKQDPNQRYLHLKIYRTAKTRLSILIGINTLNENELFSKRHIIDALNTCLQCVKIIEVPDTFIADYRKQDRVRLFYLEVEKAPLKEFQYEEIKQLKNRLQGELHNRFEQTLHPVFMPRNEEEVIRTIVLLNQQIKYPNDIPQCVISFESQSNLELSFIVILVRVCKGVPFKERLSQQNTHLKFDAWEVKELGALRKHWEKEAHIFQVSVEKALFLRKDYKVDLFQARHYIASEMQRLFGDFRDYNGGILSKQHEIFLELRSHFPSLSSAQELLLGNCFFSLNPPLMRSILPLELLQSFFELFIQLFDQPHSATLYKEMPPFLLLVSKDAHLDEVEKKMHKIKKLNISSSDLTTTSFTSNGMHFIGFALRSEEKESQLALLKTLDDPI